MSLYSYTLLAEKYHDKLQSLIENNKTVIIKGPTGCGKSTYVPYILKDKKVAIIEPRRIAVTSLYNILSEKIPNIGYKMRFNEVINSKTSMMIYTDGSFLNCIDSIDFDYIIIDEVHERSLRTDLILSVLHKSYKKKLILMSATLDTTKLEKFFGAKTFTIPGEGHPLDIKYLEQPTSDYITEIFFTIKKILKIAKEDDKKDILVFLPGEEDINEVAKLLRKIPSVAIYKIYSAMGDLEQQRIYDKCDLIKVILSTNICETSLTIPNIKYVIDTGLCKNKIFDQISYLGIMAISKESAIQRMGRCNRLGPGVCYKLYTASQTFTNSIPEITRSNLCNFILYLISLRKNIFTLDLVDYPPLENVLEAIDFLLNKKCIEMFYKNQSINLLESFDAKFADKLNSINLESMAKEFCIRITNYGRRLLYHPFDVHLSHFYEKCVENELGYYGSILVSMMSQENYNFLSPQSKLSDIENLIQVYEEYNESNDKIEFCYKKGISYKGMEISRKTIQNLNKSKKGSLEKVERIFSNCFAHNKCVRNVDGSYFLNRVNKNIHIHPTSGFFKRKDKYIVIVDAFSSSKIYGRIIGKFYE